MLEDAGDCLSASRLRLVGFAATRSEDIGMAEAEADIPGDDLEPDPVLDLDSEVEDCRGWNGSG